MFLPHERSRGQRSGLEKRRTETDEEGSASYKPFLGTPQSLEKLPKAHKLRTSGGFLVVVCLFC